VIKQLLQAQGQMPPTELVEVAGFTGTCGTIDPPSLFCQFDDGKGEIVPSPDASGFRNEPIRQKALELLNATPAYRELFGEVFPEVASGAQIDFSMFGRAMAEFEFTIVFADAPLDQFARGDRNAMTTSEKRGALLFFGKGNCVSCHAVSGKSNEMFSDFKSHVIGVPQIAPFFGVGKGNVIFDGPGQDEDFGLEQITGDLNDRYKFRTAPPQESRACPRFFPQRSIHPARRRDSPSSERLRVRAQLRSDQGRRGLRFDSSPRTNSARPRSPRSPASIADRLEPIRVQRPRCFREEGIAGCSRNKRKPVQANTAKRAQRNAGAEIRAMPR